MSRVIKGLTKLEKKPLNMQDTIRNAVAQVDSLMSERHHKLTVYMSPEAVTFMDDPKRLVQVVINLLNNAA